MDDTKMERTAIGLAADAWLRYLELLDGFGRTCTAIAGG